MPTNYSSDVLGSPEEFEKKLREFALAPRDSSAIAPEDPVNFSVDEGRVISDDPRMGSMGRNDGGPKEDTSLTYLPDEDKQNDTSPNMSVQPDLQSAVADASNEVINDAADKTSPSDSKEPSVSESKPSEVSDKPVETKQSLRDKILAKYKLNEKSDADELVAAQKEKRNKVFAANLGQGFATIASAFGPQRGKTDDEFYENLRKQAGNRIDELGEKRKQAAENLGFDKNVLDMIDKSLDSTEKESRYDPASDLSKAVRDSLRAANPELVKKISNFDGYSADSIDKYFTKLAELDMKNQERKDQLEAKKNDKSLQAKDSWVKSVTPKIGLQNDTMKNWQDMMIKKQQMIEALKNPSAFKDIGAVYSIMKAFDPRSVVRESEYRTAASAGGVVDRGLNSLDKFISGKQLQPDQRQDIMDTINITEKALRNQYVHQVEPYMKEAQRQGIEFDRFLAYPDEMEQGFNEIQAHREKTSKENQKLPTQTNEGKMDARPRPVSQSVQPSQSSNKPQGQTISEERRKTKDGRVAIFDKNSKQFIRFE